ncbi:unnamed protein product [Effrenium voratum]|uniref:GAIN-B domain-containing protein n=1 Tax=Effrenium voratum TaxID=2562239 RepID=A0AA36J7Z4_9DINO|nr:unnamed protein product [Effrenium voratum]
MERYRRCRLHHLLLFSLQIRSGCGTTTTTTGCLVVQTELTEALMLTYCSSLSENGVDLSPTAVSCGGADTPGVHMALANAMFANCGAFALYDFDSPATVCHFWTPESSCWNSSSDVCSNLPSETAYAVARAASMCTTTTSSTATTSTSSSRTTTSTSATTTRSTSTSSTSTRTATTSVTATSASSTATTSITATSASSTATTSVPDTTTSSTATTSVADTTTSSTATTSVTAATTTSSTATTSVADTTSSTATTSVTAATTTSSTATTSVADTTTSSTATTSITATSTSRTTTTSITASSATTTSITATSASSTATTSITATSTSSSTTPRPSNAASSTTTPSASNAATISSSTTTTSASITATSSSTTAIVTTLTTTTTATSARTSTTTSTSAIGTSSTSNAALSSITTAAKDDAERKREAAAAVGAAENATQQVAVEVAALLLELLTNASSGSKVPTILQETDSGNVTVAAFASFEAATIQAGDAVVDVPPELLLQAARQSSVVLLSLTNMAQDLASKIQSSQGAVTSRLVSQPLVVDFRDANGTVLEMGNLDRPLTLEMSAPGNLSGLACAFWNEGTASWSTDGMTLVGSTNNTQICETSHLSIFAIIEMVIEQSIQALDCSTAGQLLTQKAFRQLGANGDWIQHDAAVAIICMICLFCIFWWMACRQDWAAGRNLPRKTREAILFRLADESPDRDVGLIWLLYHHPVAAASHGLRVLRKLPAAPRLAVLYSLELDHARRSRLHLKSLNAVRSKGSAKPNSAVAHALSDIQQRYDVYGNAEDSVNAILSSSFWRRALTLWISLHPMLVLLQSCMFTPAKVRVALIFARVFGAGLGNAVFFANDDPDCSRSHGFWPDIVREVTVGVCSALMSSGVVLALFLLQKQSVVEKQEWTESLIQGQKCRWRCRAATFWLVWLLYMLGSLCYLCLFVGNFPASEGSAWLRATVVSLLQHQVAAPLAMALTLSLLISAVIRSSKMEQEIREDWFRGIAHLHSRSVLPELEPGLEDAGPKADDFTPGQMPAGKPEDEEGSEVEYMESTSL